MGVKVLPVTLVLLVLVGLWLVLRARRVDRLHRQVEQARVVMFNHLKTRRQILKTALNDGSFGADFPSDELAQLLATAPAGQSDHTGASESDISAWLVRVWDQVERENPQIAQKLRINGFELRAARRFYNQQVAQVVRLRSQADVRMFHLAGRAPMPEPFDFDDEAPRA